MWEKLFDKIADDYDQGVQETDRLGMFPYAGYDEVLTQIAEQVEKASHISEKRILDLGIGTAALYQKIAFEKCDIYGIDISNKMLDLARLRLGRATLLKHDFQKGIPEELSFAKFDFIISTYAMHHLNKGQFINMIDRLLNLLAPFGKILIGDVMFATQVEHDHCHEENAEYWDEMETYHVFDELIEMLDGHLQLSFMRISYCAGILIIENYHDTALQIEDSLIKYNRNTMKWKSSQPRKKSE